MRMRERLRELLRTAGEDPADQEFVGRVQSELVAELPEEDIGEDLTDCLDLYDMGSKPRCEEVEFLDLIQDAIDRIERGQ